MDNYVQHINKILTELRQRTHPRQTQHRQHANTIHNIQTTHKETTDAIQTKYRQHTHTHTHTHTHNTFRIHII